MTSFSNNRVTKSKLTYTFRVGFAPPSFHLGNAAWLKLASLIALIHVSAAMKYTFFSELPQLSLVQSIFTIYRSCIFTGYSRVLEHSLVRMVIFQLPQDSVGFYVCRPVLEAPSPSSGIYIDELDACVFTLPAPLSTYSPLLYAFPFARSHYSYSSFSSDRLTSSYFVVYIYSSV